MLAAAQPGGNLRMSDPLYQVSPTQRLNGRKHVVPLQYLMEDNTIKEPPKS
jgi:hypothetical protein